MTYADESNYLQKQTQSLITYNKSGTRGPKWYQATADMLILHWIHVLGTSRQSLFKNKLHHYEN